MTMATTFTARVRKGRLVLDEPTDLPEGAELTLVPASERPQATVRSPRLADPSEAGDFDLIVTDDSERA